MFFSSFHHTVDMFSLDLVSLMFALIYVIYYLMNKHLLYCILEFAHRGVLVLVWIITFNFIIEKIIVRYKRLGNRESTLLLLAYFA